MAGLRFGSVCSGIEAASVAWEQLGFTPAWFAEIEPFPNAVLAHHWPKVPNLGDITSDDFIERAGACGRIDILVGGTPCQGFSTSGKRGGIRDPRSGLALRFIDIARALKPTWLVWENVPGALTTAGGRDFGAFVGQVADCGYRWAYRVLDAQFFGVPQRRRRVFLVGHLGAGRPENVLFEPQSEGRCSEPSEGAGAGIAGTAATGSGGVNPSRRPGTEREADDALGRGEPITFDWQAAGAGNDTSFRGGSRRYIVRKPGKTGTLSACRVEAVVHQSARPLGLVVRKLTPRESERLQGFPDDHTLVPYRKTLAADGPRYKAIGNSIAVPVLRWIGSRLLAESNSEGVSAEVA